MEEKIMIFAPTDSLIKNAEEVLAERKLKIPIMKTELDHIARSMDEFQKHKASVLIARKGISQKARENYNVQVVDIPVMLEDYINAITQAQRYGSKIAFFFYKKAQENLVSLCKVMNLDSLIYTFSTEPECYHQMSDAKEKGYFTAIGGVVSENYSRALGIRHITIESSKESISSAIDTAISLTEVIEEKEKEKISLEVLLKKYGIVFLEMTSRGVLNVDENGNIIQINETMKHIFRDAGITWEGKQISAISPQLGDGIKSLRSNKPRKSLVEIGNRIYEMTCVPIYVENKLEEVFVFLVSADAIINREHNLRRQLTEKGLYAKYNFSHISGSSSSIKRAKDKAHVYAKSILPVLIIGETGTGKELFAQSIHNASSCSNGPFVAINCASLNSSLLESELFGYEEGAFTGAVKGGKMGLFELAHHGTIFLDEISEIPLEMQTKLLRVIEEKEVRRIGGEKIIPIDVRIISATNRDLQTGIQNGTFREDLFYRINVLELFLPPLRERREDLPEIVRGILAEDKELLHFFDLYSFFRNPVIANYPWKGNIRELKNFIYRVSNILLYVEEKEKADILIEDLIKSLSDFTKRFSAFEDGPLKSQAAFEDTEKQHILNMLLDNSFSIQKTSEQLGISRTTLWRKMKQYNIK